ncbi:MAG: ATP synthase subunit I [Ignavibacteriota bacterium]
MKIFKAVTVVGTGGALVLGGWKLAAGFLLGALISGINFYWLHKLVARPRNDQPAAIPDRRFGVPLSDFGRWCLCYSKAFPD